MDSRYIFVLFALVTISSCTNLEQEASTVATILSSKNLFTSVLGKTTSDITSKLDAAWYHFFVDPINKLYVESSSSEAYIDTGNVVITEGQSYGMMICVQMNKKVQFDKLWYFARTKMQHRQAPRAGYFAWSVKPTGEINDPGSAPDGEEYFVTALLFAAARWGNGAGIYNYQAEAQYILNAMIHVPSNTEGVTNMFDPTRQLVVFAPVGGAAQFTDPSYHLPHFYTVWSEKSSQDNNYWSQAAVKSRDFLKLTSSNSPYGLYPDYANWDGTPRTGNGDHDHFQWDAFRVVMNIGLDYAWFGADSEMVKLNEKLLSFFKSKGPNYHSLWDMNGNPQGTYTRLTGHVACNAAGTLAVKDSSLQTYFLSDFWNTPLPTGSYRYYDGMLYFLSLLAVTGNYKFYGGSTTSAAVAEEGAGGTGAGGAGGAVVGVGIGVALGVVVVVVIVAVAVSVRNRRRMEEIV